MKGVRARAPKCLQFKDLFGARARGPLSPQGPLSREIFLVVVVGVVGVAVAVAVAIVVVVIIVVGG